MQFPHPGHVCASPQIDNAMQIRLLTCTKKPEYYTFTLGFVASQCFHMHWYDWQWYAHLSIWYGCSICILTAANNEHTPASEYSKMISDAIHVLRQFQLYAVKEVPFYDCVFISVCLAIYRLFLCQYFFLLFSYHKRKMKNKITL